MDLDELGEKVKNGNSEDRQEAARLLERAFSKLLDKNRAWEYLHKLTCDEDNKVKASATQAIGVAFPNLPNAINAYEDLSRLSKDSDSMVRWIAAFSFGSAFAYVPDKTRGWIDLERLIHDPDILVQFIAIKSLGSAFAYIPNQKKAWDYLHGFSESCIGLMKQIAAEAIGSSFKHLPDKAKAWDDLHNLSWDFSSEVKEMAAYGIGLALAYVINRDLAYDDLQRLSLDGDPRVRTNAAYSIGAASASFYDRHQVLKDLHLLSQDDNKGVRLAVAYALGANFSHLPERDLICNYLRILSQDTDEGVIAFAYYSLGRAYVIKAVDASEMDALKKDLESAINHFKKSSDIKNYSLAKFCYPFYRTYFAIIFKEANEDEVKRYLAEASEAVGGSESKEDLLKAVENLAHALQESQRLKDRSIQEVASELNACRLYCENAAEYMAAAEVKAPGAVKLMRICNPLLKERIEATITEIQKKAELISPEINRAARSLSLDDPIKAYRCCMRMASVLRDSSKRLSEEQNELICGILNDIEKEADLRIVLEKIELAMAYTLPAIEAERKEILDRLTNIQFSISNLNISSGSARKELCELKTSIRSVQEKMAAQELNMNDLSKLLKERDYAMIERLEKMRDDWFKSVEKMAQDLPRTEDTVGILKELQGLKQSRRRDVLGITGDISSIAGLFISLIGLASNLKPA